MTYLGLSFLMISLYIILTTILGIKTFLMCKSSAQSVVPCGLWVCRRWESSINTRELNTSVESTQLAQLRELNTRASERMLVTPADNAPGKRLRTKIFLLLGFFIIPVAVCAALLCWTLSDQQFGNVPWVTVSSQTI